MKAKDDKAKLELLPVSELAKEAGLPGWKAAGMCKSAGWTMDKRVSKEDFNAARSHFENRRMGG